ncbi:MAG: heavy metal translocating P-type ATPase [Sarcina sp.]
MKGSSLINTMVKHSMKGRLRLYAKELKYLENYKAVLKKEIEKNDYIRLVTLNPVTGSILINYSDSSENEIKDFIDKAINKYSVAVSEERKQEKIKIKNHVKEEKTETSRDILKRIAINSATIGYTIAKEKLNLKDLYSIERFGVFGKFLTIPALVSLYLNKGLVNNAIVGAIKEKKPNADTLTLTSIISSLLLGNDKSALTITLLSDVAEFMTIYTMEKTRDSIKKMLSVSEEEVWKLLEDGSVNKVSVNKINKDDLIVIYTGEKICVDGEVVEGEAVIDQSSVTGEFMPVTRKVGGKVFAGTVIESGSITVRTEKAGDDTVVSRIVHLVEDAASKKAPIQDYADKFSTYLVPANFLFAGITYFVTKSASRALNMMVIDYSCGIKLSTATAFSAAISNAVKHGVLIKGGNYLEAMAGADTLILDKTGTLTEGKPAVTDIVLVAEEYSEDEVLKIAAAAEEVSSHPMSVAIMNKAKENNLEIPVHGEVITHVARGMETTIDDNKVLIGSRLFMKEQKISLRGIAKKEEAIQEKGGNIIYVAFKGKLIAMISMKDKIRENMRKAINNLRYQGVDDIVLLTGDLEDQAKEAALLMGVDGYKSELLPSDKAEQVLKFQSKGSKVIMVGDGINDAPALAYANIGIAMGGGSTDVAMEAADITVNGDNPMMLPTVMELSNSTMRVVKENFGLVIGINSLGLMLSSLGKLPVFWGAILHNSSTIFVIANSIRLKFFNMEKGI